MLQETADVVAPVKEVAHRIEAAWGRTQIKVEGDAAMGFAMGLAVGVLYTLKMVARP